MFETAHSLDKGDTRVTIGGTLNPESQTSYAGGSFLGIVDHGIAEKTDLRVRLERRVETEEFGIPYNYLEVGPKWSFENNWAFSMPLSIYFIEGDGSTRFLNPRFMYSQRISQPLEDMKPSGRGSPLLAISLILDPEISSKSALFASGPMKSMAFLTLL